MIYWTTTKFLPCLLTVNATQHKQIPQLITNYKTKNADGLSMLFLAVWLFGDIANLSGTLRAPPSAFPQSAYTGPSVYATMRFHPSPPPGLPYPSSQWMRS